jgi:hypothetical protein
MEVRKPNGKKEMLWKWMKLKRDIERFKEPWKISQKWNQEDWHKAPEEERIRLKTLKTK